VEKYLMNYTFWVKNFKKLFLLSFYFFLFSFTTFSFVNAFSCPDYMFSTDLQKGDTNADVKVIQEILNLDKRTIIAYSGPGSKGAETNYFGVGTREALKRFQALFIEYVGVANGKFGPRTRTTMNAVCKGAFFTGQTGSVYQTSTTTSSNSGDKIPPIVAVAGPNTASISEVFRAYIGANEPILAPDMTKLILTNATAGDLRKVSSTTYSFAVTPNQDARGPITIQFEADALSDLAKNKNSEATNEWQVALTNLNPGATTTPITIPEIPFALPNIDIPVASSDCSSVNSVDVNDYSNPCYGKVPMTYASTGGDSGGGGGGGGGMEKIMKMLEGLMKGLTGMGGGGGTDGGTEGGKSEGACSRIPTTFLTGSLGSVVGRYDTSANMGSGFFQSNGGIDPPGPIYGFKLYGSAKACRASCPGTCLGACCKPESDMTGLPVMGKVSGDRNKFNYLSN